MNKNLLLFLLGAFSLLFITSCSDDNDDDQTASNYLLTKVNYSSVGEEIYLFEYDAQNRLTKFVEQDTVDGVFGNKITTTLIYEGEKIVKRTDTSVWGDIEASEFTYKQDTIFVKNTNNHSTSTYLDTLIVNSKDQLIKNLSYRNIYTYSYDANDNLIKEVYEYVSGSDSRKYESTYEYDNSKSIFSGQNTPAWFWIFYGDSWEGHVGKNNCIKEYHDGESEFDRSFITNSDGFPTGVTYTEKVNDENKTTRVENVYSYKRY